MAGRHEWNSLDNYRRVTEGVLEGHPFIEWPDVEIQGPLTTPDGGCFAVVAGLIQCVNGATIELTKYLAVRDGRKGLEVRTRTFRYQGMYEGRELLRYDNSNGFESYHVHRTALNGMVIDDHTPITREQMPHLSDVLDELRDTCSV